jgi:hypothetical protein
MVMGPVRVRPMSFVWMSARKSACRMPISVSLVVPEPPLGKLPRGVARLDECSLPFQADAVDSLLHPSANGHEVPPASGWPTATQLKSSTARISGSQPSRKTVRVNSYRRSARSPSGAGFFSNSATRCYASRAILKTSDPKNWPPGKHPRFAEQLTVAVELIERRIYLFRGQKVSSIPTWLYQVIAKNLNLAVRRNSNRFPEDFIFSSPRKSSTT